MSDFETAMMPRDNVGGDDDPANYDLINQRNAMI